MTLELFELNEKIKRINELKSKGLNIPNFFFLKKNSSDLELEKCINWCEEKYYSSNILDLQIFNIRTYNYESKKEQINCPHITNVSLNLLEEKIFNLNGEFNCMIDIEIPNFGIYSGNIYLDLKKDFFIIDYCKKKSLEDLKRKVVIQQILNKNILSINSDIKINYKLKEFLKEEINLPGALVRNSNISISGKVTDIYLEENKLENKLSLDLMEINLFRKIASSASGAFNRDILKNVILEWTIFLLPTGIYKENLIFWEYRKK